MAFINLEKLLPRERALLGIGCLVILLAVGNWTVVRSLYSRLSMLSAKISDDRARLEQNYLIIAKVDEVKTKFDSIKAYVPKAPAAKATDALSTEVEQMAASCGVTLLDRKPQESVRVGFFERSCVRFEMTGDRDGLARLLWRTESSPQLLRVSKMQILRNTKAGAAPLKATMYITAIAQAP